MTKSVPLGKITANKKRRKVGKYSEHVGGICSHSRHLTHISEQASTNNEELAMFPHERIERQYKYKYKYKYTNTNTQQWGTRNVPTWEDRAATRNSQTRREKVGEPMARKATEVKKAKNMHCFLSMGEIWFWMSTFWWKPQTGCACKWTRSAFRKQAENFYLEIFVSTQVGGRGGGSFDSAKPGNRESGWDAVVMSIYVLCIVYYVYCICPYMKCDAHDVTLL